MISLYLSVLLYFLSLLNTVLGATYIIQLVEGYPINKFLQKHNLDVSKDRIDVINIGNKFSAFFGDLDDYKVSKIYNDDNAAVISTERHLELQEHLKQTGAPKQLSRLIKDTFQNLDQGMEQDQFVFDARSGNGVDIYLADSGIDILHPVYLQNRIHKLIDLTTHPIPGGDFNGHGTAMAGIINSNQFGVVKNANLVDVRIVDANTKHVPLTRVLSMFAFLEKHIEQTMRPSVIVLPFMTEKSPILDSAIESLPSKISVVIPAGNNNRDACNYSPMGMKKLPNVIVAGSLQYSTKNGPVKIAPFSNYGECVDVYTSGMNINTLQTGNNGSKELITSFSGTSGSCGIVAGAVAYYMSLGLNSTSAVSKIRSSNTITTSERIAIKELQLFI